MVGDHSRQMKTKIFTVRDISIRRRWISLITNPLNCWAPVPLSQINNSLSEKSGTDLWRICDISAKTGMLGEKSKILDRLGFSRHMKTRLKAPYIWQFVMFGLTLSLREGTGEATVINLGCFPLCQSDRSEISGNTWGKWNDIFRLNRANQ